MPFVYTPAQFGGRRRWLSCPWCRYRCRILYRAQRFRCRKCCGLAYSSTRQTWSERADTMADALKICGGLVSRAIAAQCRRHILQVPDIAMVSERHA